MINKLCFFLGLALSAPPRGFEGKITQRHSGAKERRGSSQAGIPEVPNNYKIPEVSSNFQKGGHCPELTTTAWKHFTRKLCQHLLNFGALLDASTSLIYVCWRTFYCWCHVRGWAMWDPISCGTGAPSTQPSPCPVQFLLPKWCSLHRARQTAQLQTANLLQESSSQPGEHGICQAWRMWDLQGPLLANPKLLKDSINQPLINNFMSKAVVVQSVWKPL